MPSCTSQSVRCASYRLERNGRTDGVTQAECASYFRLTSIPRLPHHPFIIVSNRSSGTFRLRYLTTSCRGGNKVLSYNLFLSSSWQIKCTLKDLSFSQNSFICRQLFSVLSQHVARRLQPTELSRKLPPRPVGPVWTKVKGMESKRRQMVEEIGDK